MLQNQEGVVRKIILEAQLADHPDLAFISTQYKAMIFANMSQIVIKF